MKRLHQMLVLASILMVSLIVSTTEGQTFQYSRGWTNGKRSYPIMDRSSLAPSSTRSIVFSRGTSSVGDRTVSRLKSPRLTPLSRSTTSPNNRQISMLRRRSIYRENPKSLLEILSKLIAEYQKINRHDRFIENIQIPQNQQ